MSTSMSPDLDQDHGLIDEPERPEGEKRVAGRSPTQIAIGRLRRDPIALICFGIVIFFTLVAVFAGPLCSLFGVSTDTVQASERVDLVTGLPLTGPPNHGFDPDHPFGVAPATGNDNLAYWLYGCRTSLSAGVLATFFSILIGVSLGLVAGFVGGLARHGDLLRHRPVPDPPVPAGRAGDRADHRRPLRHQHRALQRAHRSGRWWAILAVFGWMGMARLIRGEVLSLREREFVKAARVHGRPDATHPVQEILPNLVAPIVVSISLAPADLHRGRGRPVLPGHRHPGTPLVGPDDQHRHQYWETYPLFLWEPVIGIALLCVSLNLLGDSIRDALDPKTRR